jgi:hypothetical protein
MAIALFIGWRRARVDRTGVLVMFLGTTLAVAWAYRGLGG